MADNAGYYAAGLDYTTSAIFQSISLWFGYSYKYVRQLSKSKKGTFSHESDSSNYSEDTLKDIIGGSLLYNLYFSTFRLRGVENVLDFGCGDGFGSRCLANLLNRETTISLISGRFAGSVQAYVVNGPDIRVENTLDIPNQVGTSESTFGAEGQSLTYTFEPHSVAALVCTIP